MTTPTNNTPATPQNLARHLYESGENPTSSLSAYTTTKPPTTKPPTKPTSTKDQPHDTGREHNIALLSYLSTLLPPSPKTTAAESQYIQTLIRHLHPPTPNDDDNTVPTLPPLILAHNLALSHLLQNDPESGIRVLLPFFHRYSTTTPSETPPPPHHNTTTLSTSDVRCKIAFLLLDCALTLRQITRIPTTHILQWIEHHISTRTPSPTTPHPSIESITELRFRLNCYRSRVLFLRNRTEGEGGRIEANMRTARKELKSAMEIYHRKLAVGTGRREGEGRGYGRGGSMDGEGGGEEGEGEGSVVSEGVSAGGGDGTQPFPPQGDRTPFQTKKLDLQSQCALYMKANLEFLKKNTKKSLKLCLEARNAGERPRGGGGGGSGSNGGGESAITENNISDDIHQALHYNNIAITHQARGKLHIALHYYAHSLSHLERIESSPSSSSSTPPRAIEPDGTARPLSTSQILYNAALCAQQAEEYGMGYVSMVRCVGSSPEVFGVDGRCWLHMAENCIGIYSTRKEEHSGDDSESDVRRRTRLVESRISNVTPSLIIDSESSRYQRQQKQTSMRATATPGLSYSQMTRELGSENDLETIRRDPLPRALDCLNRCLQLCDNSVHTTTTKTETETETEATKETIDPNENCREAALVALAYVWMELNNPASVVRLADRVLTNDDTRNNCRLSNSPTTPLSSNIDDGVVSPTTATDSNDIDVASRRRKATMRMYACEASCMLGNPTKALGYLLNQYPKKKYRDDDGEDTTPDDGGDDDDDDLWYRHNAEQMIIDLALLGKRSGADDDSTWKPWELQRINDAKASVQLALAGACLLNSKVNAAKRMTQSVAPKSLDDYDNVVVDHEAVSKGAELTSSINNNVHRSSTSQLPLGHIDTAVQNSVLYYLIRDGKVKEALRIMRASRML